VQELRVDQLVAKARWLERSLPVQESIVTADPEDWRAHRELEALRTEARDVATELTEVGLNALDRNDLGIAGRTLPIASRLHPTTVAEKARDQLSFAETVQVQAHSRAQQHAMERLRTQESRKLLTDYQQAFAAGDLRRARLIMTRLHDLDSQNPEVARESSRLKAQLDSTIRQHIDDGNSLYGRGKFEEAVGSWNRVLELDPDHELARTSVERATRVIDKLKQLREKQAAEPKAAGVP
jgi:tetratricopeptide (TPR) repeat protein